VLSSGRTWESTSQSCTVDGNVALCRADGIELDAAPWYFGWIFDVVASAPGAYEVSAEVLPHANQHLPPRDPRRYSDSLPEKATLRLILGNRSGPLAAGKPIVSRPKPSSLKAIMSITQGSVQVRPRAAHCNGSFPSDPSYDRKSSHHPFIHLGEIHCYFNFNNARYRGKTFVGTITGWVGASKVARQFSVRIGDGTSLRSPVGAVIVTGKGTPTKK
jgi:hypothetical protein